MAAAQALLCQDILSLVFDQFDPGPVPAQNSLDEDMYRTVKAERHARRLLKGTLARCARVCHAFSGPALDALWRNMQNLGDILSALPSFTRKNRDDDAFYKSRFEGLITQEEWARFRQYAARVRSLSMGSACHQDGSVWVFLTIWCTRSSRPLLPNLAHLDLAIDTCTAHAFTILLSPSLKSLVLSVNDMIAQPYWDMAMELLRPYLKHVTSIALHPDESSDWPGWEVWAERMLSECALPRVQVLDIGHEKPMSLVLLHTLTTLTCLHTLSLGFYWRDDEDHKSFRARFYFPALRTLRLTGYLEDIADLLGLISFSGLGSLALDASEYHFSKLEPEGHLRRALSHVPATLRRFELKLVCESCDTLYQLPLGDMVLPALCNCNLEEVAFTFVGLPTQLSSKDFLETIALHWPNLAVFHLEPLVHKRQDRDTSDLPRMFKSGHEHKLPTVATLVSFVQSRPRLRRLVLPSIAIGAQTLPAPHTVPLLRHKLTDLQFCVLQPDVPIIGLATVLDRLFPELDVRYAEGLLAGSSDRPQDGRRDELALLLRALQRERREALEHGNQSG